MRRIFTDDQLQAAISKDGFVVIPLLNETEIAALKEIYHSSNPAMDKEFYLSIWSGDEDYKREVHHKILSVVQQKIQALLSDYKPVVSNFAVKNPGGKSEFDLHQGINFIDETQGHISITVWIPLQDVFPENGNMQVIRGSHKFFNQPVRSQHYRTPFSHIAPYIKEKYAENLPMKAGEAWIFDHRLLHCSPINQTQEIRIATLNVFVPRESPVILYYKPEAEHDGVDVEILEFTEDNYYQQGVEAKPKVDGLVSRGFRKENPYKVSKKDFDDLYYSANPKLGVLQRIKKALMK